MKQAVATGYAALDYPAILAGYFQGDHTVMIRKRPTDAFPRPGGSQLYVGQSLAIAGVQTSIITWVGDDSAGELFQRHAKACGINTDGIAVITPGATPVCFLLYQQDGSCGCCFDPGFMGREQLTGAQESLIKQADLLCITVGPADIGGRALSLARDDAIIAWVAKNDPLSFPEPLRRALGYRADYIFCNVSERSWIDSAVAERKKPPPVIIETNGSGNIQIYKGQPLGSVAVTQLQINDACGAGDTLAGGCLAAIINGDSDLESITTAGANAAHALLTQRTEPD